MSLLVVAAGCVSSTSQYYFPTTERRFPPKPKDAVIPIYAQLPNRPFLAIGKFAFQTPQGMSFVRKSMEYNARKNGADAVVVRNLSSQRHSWLQNIPPWVEMQSVTRRVRHCNGEEVLVQESIPIPHPGYTQIREQEITSVDAEMIVFQ